MRVGDLILRELEDVISEWTAQARSEVAAAAHEPTLLLVDSLPDLLREVAASLNHEQGCPECECWDVARKHALLCLRRDFDLAEVVQEYGILRRVLVRKLVEVAGEQPLEPLGDVLRLHEALDAAISVAVEQFSKERERTLVAEAERSRLALDAGALGMWEWFPLTGRVEWDSRTRELFGVSNAPVDYSTFKNALHPDDRARVDQIIRGKAASDATGDELCVEYRVGASERWFESRGRVVERDEEGRAVRFLGTVMDVTEHKRRERELEQTAQFRERFIAILGHDLRGPLQAMRMSATSVLGSPDAPPLVAGAARRIVSNTDRMGRMISDLLDLARGRFGGGIPIEPKEVDLREIATVVCENEELVHRGRHIACEQHGRLDGRWDPDRVAQAIANLVSNALEHGDPVAPVRMELLDEGEQVSVVVHNEGPPIPAEQREHLFAPFRRGQQRSPGLGLGLYIANEIARAHHGAITVTSTAEEGTTFRFTLPRAA